MDALELVDTGTHFSLGPKSYTSNANAEILRRRGCKQGPEKAPLVWPRSRLHWGWAGQTFRFFLHHFVRGASKLEAAWKRMQQLSRKIWNLFPYRDSSTVQNVEMLSVQDNRASSATARNVVISIGNAQSTLDECRHT